MRNRFMLLLTFLAAFAITSPALAVPPEADEKAATDDATAADDATDTKVDEKADAKAEEKAPATAEEKAAEGDTDGGTEGTPEEIKTDDEAVAATGDLINALQEKHWALALGLGLSLLVFGLRKMKVLSKVPSKILPWVTAGIGVVTYVAAALMADGANMTDAILGGATAGIAAVGLWEMVLKHFLAGKEETGGSED